MKSGKGKANEEQTFQILVNCIATMEQSIERKFQYLLEQKFKLVLNGQAKMISMIERILSSKQEKTPSKIQPMGIEEDGLSDNLSEMQQYQESEVEQSQMNSIQPIFQLSPRKSDDNSDPLHNQIIFTVTPENNIEDNVFELDYEISKRESKPKIDNGIDIQKVMEALQEEFSSMDLAFQKTQRLYEYPQMEQQNYMSRILDKDNLLIVISLCSGQTVGAFTQTNFSSRPVLIPRDNPKCFLFNLTNKHCLFSYKTNKTHARDTNYLTFGSWEIKLKVGQLEFESQLGTKADCFRRRTFRGEEVDRRRQWFFGEDAELKRFPIQRMGIYVLK